MAKQRQHENQGEANLVSLAEQQKQEHHCESAEEKARELVAEDRLHEHNIEENMLIRSEEENDAK